MLRATSDRALSPVKEDVVRSSVVVDEVHIMSKLPVPREWGDNLGKVTPVKGTFTPIRLEFK